MQGGSIRPKQQNGGGAALFRQIGRGYVVIGIQHPLAAAAGCGVRHKVRGVFSGGLFGEIRRGDGERVSRQRRRNRLDRGR